MWVQILAMTVVLVSLTQEQNWVPVRVEILYWIATIVLSMVAQSCILPKELNKLKD